MTADLSNLGTGLRDLDVPDEPDKAEFPDIDKGRYRYCIVRVRDDPNFETSGVGDKPTSVVGVDSIGSVQDNIAATPKVEVRFSGSWLPYTLAPQLGNKGT
jgi:hypothetical protein